MVPQLRAQSGVETAGRRPARFGPPVVPLPSRMSSDHNGRGAAAVVGLVVHIPIFRKIHLYGKIDKSTHGHQKKTHQTNQAYFPALVIFEGNPPWGYPEYEPTGATLRVRATLDLAYPELP